MSRQRTIIPIFLVSIALLISGGSQAAEKGRDFLDEARVIHTVAACGDGQVPSGIDPTVVELHCREVRRHVVQVRKDFVNKARPFISGLLPAHLPKNVIYPFGGGDLLTALATYPNAAEITTISLESAGDPRRLGKAGRRELRDGLAEFRAMLVYLLTMHDNPTANLPPFERGIIPGQLAFSLAAAVVYEYEPVSLRYFLIKPDGTLSYLTEADIAALEGVKAKKLASFMPDPDFSPAFRNMELTLRRRAPGPGPETIVHRHIAANLSDRHFGNSSLKKHLESQGKISAMTKAGGYLLWRDDFSIVRAYLLANMKFMISDSTGILPRHARAAGFEQITYGTFNGAFLENKGGDDAAELRRLWQSQPYRQLAFRYGYSDILGANHLMVTKPKEAGR
jgi:hypothetical protein